MGFLGVLLFFWPVADHYILQKIDGTLFKNRFETGLIIGIVFIVFYLAWAVAEAQF